MCPNSYVHNANYIPIEDLKTKLQLQVNNVSQIHEGYYVCDMGFGGSSSRSAIFKIEILRNKKISINTPVVSRPKISEKSDAGNIVFYVLITICISIIILTTALLLAHSILIRIARNQNNANLNQIVINPVALPDILPIQFTFP